LISAQLNSTSKESSDAKFTAGPEGSNVQTNHHAALLELLAQEISVAPEEIHDFEL
jgi:aspartyl aminopeptidase